MAILRNRCVLTRKPIMITAMLAAILMMVVSMESCSEDNLDQQAYQAADQPFSWTRGTVVETRYAWLRNFGVGYGYDGVGGSYCSYDDIRAQVINREALRAAEDIYGPLSMQNTSTYSSVHQKVYYSEHDYISSFDFASKEKVSCLLYNGEMRKRQYILEDGLRQSFYYVIEERHVKGEQRLSPYSIQTVIKDGHDRILTLSFRKAISHLSEVGCQTAAVDSFIKVYGTHVVTQAVMGGSLRLELKNSMKRYRDQVAETAYSSDNILFAFSNREESRQKWGDAYGWVEESSINVAVRGGDQSLLSGVIGERSYDGKRAVDLSVLSQWASSITFNTGDDESVNAEMLAMECEPIWDFIPDRTVREAVRARISADAAQARQLLGDKNFASCSFPLRHDAASCQVARTDGTWQTVSHHVGRRSDRHVVLVVSLGRYVAMQCYEYLSARSVKSQYYWTVYPISDTSVNLYGGYAVGETDGKVYGLVRNGASLQPQLLADNEQPAQTETVYLNGGQLSFSPQDGYAYADARQMLYVEPTHGVNTDGSVDVTYALVDKNSSTEFMIEIPADGPQDIGEQWNLVFTGYNGDKVLMNTYMSSADYIGYYNPREVREVKGEK